MSHRNPLLRGMDMEPRFTGVEIQMDASIKQEIQSTRKRYVVGSSDSGNGSTSSAEAIAAQSQLELDRLRKLVEEAEYERRSCHRETIEPSMMSMVFAIVLVMILSVSIYAFTSFYRALMKRFYQ